MTTETPLAARERAKLARQLAETREAFREAARRRKVARERGDTVGEARAEISIEAAFRNRDRIVADAARLGAGAFRPMDGDVPAVRPSVG